ncbi:MAG: hypothetical protein ACR5LF_14910 [Symbiopectobacterium sp.]
MDLHASDVRPKPGVCENFRHFSDTLEDLRKAIDISQEDTRAQMYAKKARLPYTKKHACPISGIR